jgi:hypothetical protein
VSTSTICPGCGGPKTRRAELCKTCRLSANRIGAQVVESVATSAPELRPRTAIQNTVYHARLTDLAELEMPEASPAKRRLRVIELKQWALAHATAEVRRPIASSTDLTEPEMERLLEWLDEQYLERANALHAKASS